VRRLLARPLLLDRSVPSLTEKMPCEGNVGEEPTLYEVPEVSPEVMVEPLAAVSAVEVEDVVSFRRGGESAGVWWSGRPEPGDVVLFPERSSSLRFGGASSRLGAGCISSWPGYLILLPASASSPARGSPACSPTVQRRTSPAADGAVCAAA